jgi:hypothetical protein
VDFDDPDFGFKEEDKHRAKVSRPFLGISSRILIQLYRDTTKRFFEALPKTAMVPS